jgi:inhibitor of KinA
MQLLPLGDTAILVRVGDTIDATTHARVRAVCDALDRAPIPGLIEFVPAYAAVAVHYDPAAFGDVVDGPLAGIAAALENRLADLEVAVPPPGRLVEVPVRYGGAHGPDLAEVAQHAGMTSAEVVREHAAAEYTVYMIGFAPGFPYLGGLAERLALPRRETPRLVVPAGSVAIGGRQTGIYPLQMPGGWHIIGRTSMRLFRPEDNPPTLLRLGDRVRFIADDG